MVSIGWCDVAAATRSNFLQNQARQPPRSAAFRRFYADPLPLRLYVDLPGFFFFNVSPFFAFRLRGGQADRIAAMPELMRK